MGADLIEIYYFVLFFSSLLLEFFRFFSLTDLLFISQNFLYFRLTAFQIFHSLKCSRNQILDSRGLNEHIHIKAITGLHCFHCACKVKRHRLSSDLII